MSPGDPLKHRMGLWLRSERALGLPSVPHVDLPEASPAPTTPPIMMGRSSSAPPRSAPAQYSRPLSTASPSRPAPPPAPAPAPAAASRAQRAIKDLFGAPAASAMPPTAALPVVQTPIEGPELSREEKIRALDELNRSRVAACTACGLHETRQHTVFGEGDPEARLCFVGEGPGKDEDASGRPFVGRAGQKLDDMIRAMGLRRDQVYICNIVKCRAFVAGPPAKDRPPTDEEVAACSPRLIRQLEIIRPKVIVTLGLPSTRFLLQKKESMSRMRGNWHVWRGIKVMPTWHPAYVLRNYTAETRQQVWEDLKKVMTELGLPLPNKSGKQT